MKIVQLLLVIAITYCFKHKTHKSQYRTASRLFKSQAQTLTDIKSLSFLSQDEFNDDSRKLYNLLTKLKSDDKSNSKEEEQKEKVTVIIKKSEHFQSMDDLHSLDYEKLCDVRQGYAIRYKENESSVEGKQAIITFEPTFLVLNNVTLSLYMNENINSLLIAYPLVKIEAKMIDTSGMQDRLNRLPLSTKNYEQAISGNYLTCFILQYTQDDKTVNSKETLCWESQRAAVNWIVAIKHFRSCEVRLLAEGESLTDFSNSSTITTYSRNETNNFVRMRVEKAEKVNQITKEEQEAFKNIVNQQSESRNTYLKDAIEQFKRQQMYYKQQIEIEQMQQKQQEQETSDSINQIDCLMNQEGQDIANRDKTDVTTQITIAKKEEQTLEQQLIKQLLDITQKTTTQNQQMEEERQDSQRRSTKIIQNFGIAQVEANYVSQIQLCYDPKLGMSDPKKNGITDQEAYINGHCKTIISYRTSEILKGKTIDLLQQCMDPDNYCNFCCAFESGVVNVNNEEECKEKCANALKNIVSPRVSVTLTLNSNSRQKNNENEKKQENARKFRRLLRK